MIPGVSHTQLGEFDTRCSPQRQVISSAEIQP